MSALGWFHFSAFKNCKNFRNLKFSEFQTLKETKKLKIEILII
jgi:hypothetical protein